MKTPGQRGAFGEWLTRERIARFPNRQSDALEAYRRMAGLSIAPSEYAQWESGSRTPRPDNPKVQALYDFYGTRPEDPPPAEPAGDLAAAIRELTTELREARQERATLAAKVAEMEAILDGLVAPAIADAGAPRAPHEKAGSGR